MVAEGRVPARGRLVESLQLGSLTQRLVDVGMIGVGSMTGALVQLLLHVAPLAWPQVDQVGPLVAASRASLQVSQRARASLTAGAEPADRRLLVADRRRRPLAQQVHHQATSGVLLLAGQQAGGCSVERVGRPQVAMVGRPGRLVMDAVLSVPVLLVAKMVRMMQALVLAVLARRAQVRLIRALSAELSRGDLFRDGAVHLGRLPKLDGNQNVQHSDDYHGHDEEYDRTCDEHVFVYSALGCALSRLLQRSVAYGAPLRRMRREWSNLAVSLSAPASQLNVSRRPS